MDGFSQRWVGGQLGYPGEAELDRFGVPQGCANPFAKASCSDWRRGVVDEVDQRRKLEVANRGCIERHGRVWRIRANSQELRPDPSLIGLEVLEHHARGADRQRCLCGAD